MYFLMGRDIFNFILQIDQLKLKKIWEIFLLEIIFTSYLLR